MRAISESANFTAAITRTPYCSNTFPFLALYNVLILGRPSSIDIRFSTSGRPFARTLQPSRDPFTAAVDRCRRHRDDDGNSNQNNNNSYTPNYYYTYIHGHAKTPRNTRSFAPCTYIIMYSLLLLLLIYVSLLRVCRRRCTSGHCRRHISRSTSRYTSNTTVMYYYLRPMHFR